MICIVSVLDPIVWQVCNLYRQYYKSEVVNYTPLCHRPSGAPAPLEKLAKNRLQWKKYPKISSPLGYCPMILFPWEIEWKKLHSKTIPTGTFELKTIDFLSHWDEIFIHNQIKSQLFYCYFKISYCYFKSATMISGIQMMSIERDRTSNQSNAIESQSNINAIFRFDSCSIEILSY